MAAPDVVELCKQLAALPIGTVVKFEEGVDFTVRPHTFRNKLHREMRNEGYLVQTVVHSDAVYAKVKRAVGELSEPVPAATGNAVPATGSEPDAGPALSLIVSAPRAVLGQTNPAVPVAVFQVPLGSG